MGEVHQQDELDDDEDERAHHAKVIPHWEQTEKDSAHLFRGLFGCAVTEAENLINLNTNNIESYDLNLTAFSSRQFSILKHIFEVQYEALILTQESAALHLNQAA